MNRALPNAEAVARALARCELGPGGCLLWPGATTDSGHARMSVEGRMQRMHRIALATKLGRPLEAHELARHTCDVARCLCADHLIPGTALDNVRDMMERGRFVRRAPVLDAEKAAAARAARRGRRARKTVAQLAAELGVRKRQVERILSGRAW